MFNRLSFAPCLIAAVGGLLVAVSSAACGLQGPAAHIESDRIKELSGMASAQSEDEFWCLNDSGNPAAIYRIRQNGELLQTVTVEGAANVDWEAMARDERGNLLIGDVGDNSKRRSEYQIYRVAEPAAEQPFVTPLEVLRFRYEDSLARDCESIFVFAGRIYLIAKQPGPGSDGPEVFRLDPPEAGTARAKRVARLAIQTFVTDAAYSAGRKELAVLTYGGFLLFRVATEADLGSEPVRRHPAFLGIAEALTYRGDKLIVTNEPGSIWVFTLPGPESATGE